MTAATRPACRATLQSEDDDVRRTEEVPSLSHQQRPGRPSQKPWRTSPQHPAQEDRDSPPSQYVRRRLHHQNQPVVKSAKSAQMTLAPAEAAKNRRRSGRCASAGVLICENAKIRLPLFLCVVSTCRRPRSGGASAGSNRTNVRPLTPPRPNTGDLGGNTASMKAKAAVIYVQMERSGSGASRTPVRRRRLRVGSGRGRQALAKILLRAVSTNDLSRPGRRLLHGPCHSATSPRRFDGKKLLARTARRSSTSSHARKLPSAAAWGFLPRKRRRQLRRYIRRPPFPRPDSAPAYPGHRGF